VPRRGHGLPSEQWLWEFGPGHRATRSGPRAWCWRKHRIGGWDGPRPGPPSGADRDGLFTAFQSSRLVNHRRTGLVTTYRSPRAPLGLRSTVGPPNLRWRPTARPRVSSGARGGIPGPTAERAGPGPLRCSLRASGEPPGGSTRGRGPPRAEGGGQPGAAHRQRFRETGRRCPGIGKAGPRPSLRPPGSWTEGRVPNEGFTPVDRWAQSDSGVGGSKPSQFYPEIGQGCGPEGTRGPRPERPVSPSSSPDDSDPRRLPTPFESGPEPPRRGELDHGDDCRARGALGGVRALAGPPRRLIVTDWSCERSAFT
jgi:hypothetical protein